MSQIIINDNTYDDVLFETSTIDDADALVITIPLGYDLDTIKEDFSALDNAITIDDGIYEGYVVFVSMEVTESVKVEIRKKTTSERLDEQDEQITELQEALAELV